MEWVLLGCQILLAAVFIIAATGKLLQTTEFADALAAGPLPFGWFSTGRVEVGWVANQGNHDRLIVISR